MYQLGSQWMDFRDILYLGLTFKSVKKIQVWLKPGKKNHKDLSVFYIADSDICSSTIENSICYCFSMATLSLLSNRYRSFSSTMGQLICALGTAKNRTLHTVLPLCYVMNNKVFKMKKKKASRAWFRSTDLWVMGPARFHCATLLRLVPLG